MKKLIIGMVALFVIYGVFFLSGDTINEVCISGKCWFPQAEAGRGQERNQQAIPRLDIQEERP